MSRILLAIAIFLSTVLLAMIVVPRMIDWNGYRDFFAQKIQNVTGQNVVIKGDIDINLLPVPSVTINDVYAFHKKQQIFFASQIDIKISPIPIITGQIILEKVNIIKPQFHIIEENQQYISILQNIKTKKSFELQNIFVHGIKIQDASIIYLNNYGKNIFEIENINATYIADFVSGPHNIKGEVLNKNNEFQFKLKIFNENEKIKVAGSILTKNKTQIKPFKINFEGDLQNLKKKITDIQLNAKINLQKGDFEKNYDLWKINNDNSVKNIDFYIKAKKENITIKQIQIKIKKNNFNEKIKIDGSINIKINKNNLIETKLKIDFFEIAQDNEFQKIINAFNSEIKQNIKKNLQIIQENIQSIKAEIEIDKLIIGDKLFQNTIFRINKNNNKNNKIYVETKYDKNSHFQAQFEKNNYWKTKIVWKTSKLRQEVKKIYSIFNQVVKGEIENIKYQKIPKKAQIQIEANNENNIWKLQKLLVKYDDKIIRVDINRKKQKAILNINNVEIDKWYHISQILWKYHNKINRVKRQKQPIIQIKWEVVVNNSKWEDFYLPQIKAKLNTINSIKNTEIEIINATIKHYRKKIKNKNVDTEDIIINGKIILNNNTNNNYYIDKGRIYLKAQKIKWEQYFGKFIKQYIQKQNIQQFLLENPLQQVKVEIYADANKNNFAKNNFALAIAAKAEAEINENAKITASLYYETKNKYKNDAKIKISLAGFGIPIKKILPELLHDKQYQDKADFNLYIAKKYQKQMFNLNLKVRYQDKAYKIKADIYNDHNNNINTTGIVKIDNIDPWDNSIIKAKTKTDIKAKIKWQNQVFKIKSDLGIINDNNTKFAITVDNRHNQSKMNKIDAILYLQKIDLDKIGQYLTGENKTDLWKSKLPLKIQFLQNTQARILIDNNQIILNQENVLENNQININTNGKITSIKIKGEYQKGNIAIELQNNNNNQETEINGKIKIENAKPDYLNNPLTNIDVSFVTEGGSLAEIIRNLSGQGKFEMQNAYIKGFDGNGMAKIGNWIVNQSEKNFIISIRRLKGEQYQMPYSNIKGDFDLQKGFLNSSNIQIKAPYYEMDGAVFIDIPLRQIDANFRLHNKTIPKAPSSQMTFKGKWNDINKKINFDPVIGHYNIVRLEKELIRTEKVLKPIEKKYNIITTPN